jgi:hypothetical protein
MRGLNLKDVQFHAQRTMRSPDQYGRARNNVEQWRAGSVVLRGRRVWYMTEHRLFLRGGGSGFSCQRPGSSPVY